MKDFLGKTLSLGDKVVYSQQGYREFRIGVIERFTNCYVVIQTNGEPFRQLPSQVILIEG